MSSFRFSNPFSIVVSSLLLPWIEFSVSEILFLSSSYDFLRLLRNVCLSKKAINTFLPFFQSIKSEGWSFLLYLTSSLVRELSTSVARIMVVDGYSESNKTASMETMRRKREELSSGTINRYYRVRKFWSLWKHVSKRHAPPPSLKRSPDVLLLC